MCSANRVRVFAVGCLVFSSFCHLSAEDKPSQIGAVSELPSNHRIHDGYRLQESDDLAMPLDPVVPRSAAKESRNEALSWFMIGRLFDANHRNEPRKSLLSYRKALKQDPETIEIYRNLIPIETDPETVIRYATKAVQLDPGDFEILELLAAHAAQNGKLPEAIKFAEKAMKSPKVRKFSPEFVVLNMTLGKLYMVTGQRDLAADAYEIIFDAVKTPEKYGMDSSGKNKILADALTNYEQIGQVLLDGNRPRLALEAFELAGKSSRLGAGNLIYNRARVLYLTGKPEEALTELQKYFDSQRTSKRRLPYQLLADILAKLNRSDELIGRLDKMAEKDAQNDSLQFFLADRLVDVKELDRAKAIYDTMLRNGGDASGYAGLARVLREMHKADELLDVLGRGFARGKDAISALEPEIKAISEDKPLLTSIIEAGQLRGKANELKFEEAYLLAKFAAALKNADAAGQFFRLAMSLNRNPARANVELQLEMADMFLKLHKYALAVDVYQEAVSNRQLSDFGQMRALFGLAQALANNNQTEEALETIGKAINLTDERPFKAQLHFFEAGIYSHARRWDEAIAKYEQLMKDFSDEGEWILLSQFSISSIYVQKGEMRKGEEILEKVYEVNPENSQVNNDLGYLWADQGKNLEHAEAMIRKALAAEPENGAYLDSLGWVLFKQGKYEEAVTPLEQATRKSINGDATVWDHLGDAFIKMMKVEKAIESWQTALQHAEDEATSDAQLLDRLKDKLKQYGSNPLPKPSEKGAP